LRDGASTQIESVGRCNATRKWTKRSKNTVSPAYTRLITKSLSETITREKDQALGNAQERAAQLQAKQKEFVDARQLLDDLRGVKAGQHQAVETARANAS